MSDKSNEGDKSQDTNTVRVTQGKSVTLSESPLERGFKPTKPINLAQPDNLPVPPSPPQTSQAKPTADSESQSNEKSQK